MLISVIAKFVGIALFLYGAIALLLIATQKTNTTPGTSLDFSRQSVISRKTTKLHSFTARDGADLNYRRYGKNNGPLIVVIHGSSAHGGLYEELAIGLSNSGMVIVPDLRGHGAHAPSGDVNYIGQLEDDLADLIASTREDKKQSVVLVGHSSGGGLAIRYNGHSDQIKSDGIVLLAPYLGHNSPTMREDAGGWAQPLVRRIVGLTLLNAVGVRILNHLPVITFRLPENSESLQMTESYSYRMNTSFSPRQDFKQDLASLPTFKIIVGDQDEAFLPNEFEPLLQSFENAGSVDIVNGISHLDIIGNAAVHEKIHEFVVDLDSNQVE